MNRLINTALAVIISASASTVAFSAVKGNAKKAQNKNQAIAFFEKELEFTTGPYGAKLVIEGKKEKVTIIDVRSAEAFAKGHIPGAINIPHEKFDNFEDDKHTFEGLRKDGYNYVYCYELLCNLAQKAALQFAKKGYPVKEIKGGFKSWEEHKYPVEKGQ